MHPVQAVWPAVSTISIYNTIKDPQWYVVQGSDTTMMPIAASLPGQQFLNR